MSSKCEIKQTDKITPILTRPLDAIVSGNKQIIVCRVVAGSSVNDDRVDLALGVNHPPKRSVALTHRCRGRCGGTSRRNARYIPRVWRRNARRYTRAVAAERRSAEK